MVIAGYYDLGALVDVPGTQELEGTGGDIGLGSDEHRDEGHLADTNRANRSHTSGAGGGCGATSVQEY